MKKNLKINNLMHYLLPAGLLFLSACSEQKPPVQLTVNDYPEPESDAVKLYLEKCGSCHGAPLPEIHDANQWMSVVQRMQYRMTSKAMPKLNKYEMSTIVGYLQKHARKK